MTDTDNNTPDRWPRWGIPAIVAIILAAAGLWWARQEALRLFPPKDTRFIVCVDPGHPTSFNSGAHWVNGLREVDVNWDVAQRLRELLEKRHDVKVVMTRRGKHRVMENSERAIFANEAGADLLISLHCDYGRNHGFTVYYPNRQGTDLGVTGPSWSVIESSRHAAYSISAGMASVISPSLKNRGVRGENFTRVGAGQGALTKSIFSQVPVVTVEMVFLNNRYDARFIASPSGQSRMARALANGVMGYLTSQKTR